jgi:hypothetical protein
VIAALSADPDPESQAIAALMSHHEAAP